MPRTAGSLVKKMQQPQEVIMTSIPADYRNTEFLAEFQKVKQKAGKQPLDDGDLLMLAGEEISRTYTREEVRYAT